MAVLTRDAILREMELGRLRVEPFSPDQLGPASIDLTLGDEIRVIEPAGPPIVISEDADYYAHQEQIISFQHPDHETQNWPSQGLQL